MAGRSPTQLYAIAAGVVLVILGVGGFFYSASFGSPGQTAHLFGAFRVNAWDNVLHGATGAAALLAPDARAARRAALAIGCLYLVLAIWGFALGAAGAILGFLPVGRAEDALHLALALLGIGAYAAGKRRGAAIA